MENTTTPITADSLSLRDILINAQGEINKNNFFKAFNYLKQASTMQFENAKLLYLLVLLHCLTAKGKNFQNISSASEEIFNTILNSTKNKTLIRKALTEICQKYSCTDFIIPRVLDRLRELGGHSEITEVIRIYMDVKNFKVADMIFNWCDSFSLEFEKDTNFVKLKGKLGNKYIPKPNGFKKVKVSLEKPETKTSINSKKDFKRIYTLFKDGKILKNYLLVECLDYAILHKLDEQALEIYTKLAKENDLYARQYNKVIGEVLLRYNKYNTKKVYLVRVSTIWGHAGNLEKPANRQTQNFLNGNH